MKGTDEVLQDDNDDVAPVRTWRRFIRPALSLALVAFLLGYVLPHAVDTTASDISNVLEESVTPRDVALLLLVWASGILVHSLTLTGALPGLTTRRAVTLNMTGSAVSNVIPFGGAVGMSLNYVMIRGWGMEPTAFAAYTVVTNIWVILIKFALPVLAAVALLGTGVGLGTSLTWAVVASAIALTGAITLVVTAVINRRVAVRVTTATSPLVVRIGSWFKKSPDPEKILAGVLDTREKIVAVFRRAWLQMAIGMTGWTISQVALLWGCLHVVGIDLNLAIVFAAYAVDRVATLIVLTPGASGFVEIGTVGVLVYLAGGDPKTDAMMLAGALLYRAFSYAIEIPVGGVWLGGWLLVRRRNRKAEEATGP